MKNMTDSNNDIVNEFNVSTSVAFQEVSAPDGKRHLEITVEGVVIARIPMHTESTDPARSKLAGAVVKLYMCGIQDGVTMAYAQISAMDYDEDDSTRIYH